MRKYQPTRTRLTWAHLIIAVLLAAVGHCLSGCADVEPLPVDPCDARRIEGRWMAVAPSHPLWEYDFSNPPHLVQRIVDFGVVLTVQEYIWAASGDTLFVSGAGGQRTWLVCFPTDSTAEYRQWDVWKWSPVRGLKRKN